MLASCRGTAFVFLLRETNMRTVPSLAFDLLALDTGDESPIQTELHLLHSLLGNGRLWWQPRLDSPRIVDEDLALAVVPIAGDPELRATLNKAFLIRTTAPLESLEPFREPLVEHLRRQSFERVYILTDEVSETIACKIYPLIYKVENLLAPTS